MAIRGGLRAGQLGVTLIVRDVPAAAAFYRAVLGAREIARYRGTDPVPPGEAAPDAIEMRLGDAHLLVTVENPRWREAPRPDWPRSPESAGTTSTAFTLYVDDVDAVFAQALAAGATRRIPTDGPEDSYWGDRVAQFLDPAGHPWRIQTRREDIERAELPARLAAARTTRQLVKQAAH
ncbi:MAG TPA: VOC family protein [Roseomonas sp.]|jgi:PhnB protein